jgi:tetratricopeptide (TPR) repeat protein
MEDEKKPDGSFDGTNIDLGEDLLEATRVIERPPTPIESAQAPVSPTDGDELQHGEILFGEKLFDDAKKVLRKILRKNSNSPKAKELLDEIQRQEIQDLLGNEVQRRRLGSLSDADNQTPKEVLNSLEAALHMDIDRIELRPIPDLFKTEVEFEKYKEHVLDEVIPLGPKDRIDVGVAHLEMGLHEVAQAIFQSVIRYDEYKIVGMYLLGLALIHGGKAIEATIRIEPIARDLTLPESQKIDFLYLMGLAFEKLEDHRKAKEFFRRVHMLNPRYREVAEKVLK